MIYAVVWKPAAETELARLWIAAPDRAAVTAAADAMDATLRKDPFSNSESRDHLNRIMIVAPLAIHYRVSEKDRLVSVLEVWRSRRPAG